MRKEQDKREDNYLTWYSWKYTNPVQMEKRVQAIWNIGTMRIASNNDKPSLSLAICSSNTEELECSTFF